MPRIGGMAFQLSAGDTVVLAALSGAGRPLVEFVLVVVTGSV